MRLIDLSRQTFGRLTVIARAANSRGGTARWDCVCICGGTCTVFSENLRSGHTTSCGCFRVETNVLRLTTHGHTMCGPSPEYQAWQNMMKRCYYKKHNRFYRYGARGIYVVRRWHKFENFLSDMGLRPSAEYTIEREDNDGPYCRRNCVWATRSAQMANRGDS